MPGRGARRLAAVLHKKITGSSPMKLDDALFGKVVSIQQGTNIDTLTLQVGGTGSLIVGVEHLNSYDPHAGDQVYYHVIHGVPFVLGVMGSFVPYPVVPPGPPPTAASAWLAYAPYDSSSRVGSPLTCYSFAASGVQVAHVATPLGINTPFDRPPARWAAMNNTAAFLAVVGYISGTGNEVIIYSLPSLHEIVAIPLSGGTLSDQCAVVWDPLAIIVYVYDANAGTITGYDTTGATVAGPATVADFLAETPVPVLSATDDGYIWMSDGTTLGAWFTGTLYDAGGVPLTAAPDGPAFVATGDGLVDVLGGGKALTSWPATTYSLIDPSLFTEGVVAGSVTGGGLAASINSVAWSVYSDDFAGYDFSGGGPSSFPLVVSPVVHEDAVTVATDLKTGLALGHDFSNNLYMTPFYADGTLGTPVLLRSLSFTPSTDNGIIWMASQYSAPALSVYTF